MLTMFELFPEFQLELLMQSLFFSRVMYPHMGLSSFLFIAPLLFHSSFPLMKDIRFTCVIVLYVYCCVCMYVSIGSDNQK